MGGTGLGLTRNLVSERAISKRERLSSPGMPWVALFIEKTGNVVAVQRQLGHKNAMYSMPYTRVTRDKVKAVLDERR